MRILHARFQALSFGDCATIGKAAKPIMWGAISTSRPTTHSSHSSPFWT